MIINNKFTWGGGRAYKIVSIIYKQFNEFWIINNNYQNLFTQGGFERNLWKPLKILKLFLKLCINRSVAKDSSTGRKTGNNIDSVKRTKSSQESTSVFSTKLETSAEKLTSASEPSSDPLEMERYKQYEQLLLSYKSWTLVWITVAIVPYGLLIMYVDINLTWGMFFLQTLLSGFITPMLLTVAWERCTAKAVIIGE